MDFPPFLFASGVFLPEDIEVIRATYEKIVAQSWFARSPAKRAEFARYVLAMYRRGMVIPQKLETICLIAARERFMTLDAENGIAGRRILVVEDEYYLAHEVAENLEKLGADVVGPVGTLSEALEIVGNSDVRVDAALLDIALNGEMVFPVAAILKMRQIAFAFISGYDELAIPPSYRRTPKFAKPADWTDIAVRLLDEMA